MTDEEYEARAAALLIRLSRFEAEYNSGQKYELFDALVFCARYQIVIPEWAANALLNMREGVTDGEEADLNSAFGWDELPREKRNRATRVHDALLRKNKKRVIEAIFHHRLEGGSLNTDVGLGEVAEELGLGRRVVEDIYKEAGRFAKEIPRKRGDKNTYGIMVAALPPERRVGRKLICGCKEET